MNIHVRKPPPRVIELIFTQAKFGQLLLRPLEVEMSHGETVRVVCKVPQEASVCWEARPHGLTMEKEMAGVPQINYTARPSRRDVMRITLEAGRTEPAYLAVAIIQEEPDVSGDRRPAVTHGQPIIIKPIGPRL